MRFTLIPTAEWLETEAQVIEAARYLQQAAMSPGLGVDTETTGLDIVRDFPLMFSLSDGRRRFSGMFELAQHPAICQGLLENPAIPKIGTNIKFDKHMCANRGVNLQGPLIDTVVESWLHNENRFSHGLKETAKDFCGIKMREFAEVFPMRKKTKTVPAETPGEAIRRKLSTPEGKADATEYAGLDAFASVKVHEHLKEQLQSEYMFNDRSLWDHFVTVEMPFTEVLWRMERRGFMLSVGHLATQLGPIDRGIEAALGELAQAAGWAVNPQSPKQLQQLFFSQLQMKPLKWTSGGTSGVKSPSTDEDTLKSWIGEDLQPAATMAKMVLKARGLRKTKGTYIEPMIELVDNNLRLHTTLKQHGTVTGRLSSADPNIQNIPRPDNDEWQIRDAFIAAPGKILVVCDYDQLEMKLMAHFSKDEKMIGAILNGMDLHCFTVSLMFGVTYEEVIEAKNQKERNKKLLTDRQKILLGYRQAAKATGFGLIYGIGAVKLAQGLTDELKRHVDKKEGRQLINKYFMAFPGVKRFIDETHASCEKVEYVQTLMGRFRRLPEINAHGGDDDPDGEAAKGTAAQARRQAVNSIIQGTAADVAKQAMIRAEHDSRIQEAEAQLLLQVHDELIFEVDEEDKKIEQTIEAVEDIMCEPWPGFSLSIPLTATAHSGYTWVDAK